MRKIWLRRSISYGGAGLFLLLAFFQLTSSTPVNGGQPPPVLLKLRDLNHHNFAAPLNEEETKFYNQFQPEATGGEDIATTVNSILAMAEDPELINAALFAKDLPVLFNSKKAEEEAARPLGIQRFGKRSVDEKVDGNERRKRFTMNFNGMQVSYPTYIRLQRLQTKVLRLQKMIQYLHVRYSAYQLGSLPQYGRLMKLYKALEPLLPIEGDPTESKEAAIEAFATGQGIFDGGISSYEDSRENAGTNEGQHRRVKRDADFNGMSVSFPTYSKLLKIQNSVLKLDKTMKHLVSSFGIQELSKQPQWRKMVKLRRALNKMMPEDTEGMLGKAGKGLENWPSELVPSKMIHKRASNESQSKSLHNLHIQEKVKEFQNRLETLIANAEEEKSDPEEEISIL